ncbi:hypothetical protein BO94DRAFT_479632 [Aspergillus sclerotioniger CBS 115572]|uniref:Uncharacterized protein n=1 Tax=Aspergillus sclerotioniger CBS 115572 TaxID=1450535 RepID=A0A317V0Q0_9EURO|nr:hypothetical protein BO94DRAFT_479632 [Aspergillus sclerotioniger CBS 115572]PWY66397.1 hypothetical protein BO94DRAFT_479632 [Aspergillus sclerotioniger CBS 115572]
MVRETHLPVFNGRKGVQMHDEILRKALKALIDEEIPVVEYGSQILYRWGWAEVLMGAEWAVPDDLLTFASQTLADNGFPEASKPDCNYYLGGWVDLSRFHKDAVYGSMIYLYPLSVLGLTLEDTFEVPSTFDHKQQLLTPKPPRYMLSMIHHLVNSSVADYSIRHQVISDLAGFMHGYIFHGPPADTQYNTAEEEEAAEREFMEMVPSAIQEIRSWDWGDVPDPEYLDIAEKVVRDARELDKITKAVKAAPDESPANPSTATSM